VSCRSIRKLRSRFIGASSASGCLWRLTKRETRESHTDRECQRAHREVTVISDIVLQIFRRELTDDRRRLGRDAESWQDLRTDYPTHSWRDLFQEATPGGQAAAGG